MGICKSNIILIEDEAVTEKRGFRVILDNRKEWFIRLPQNHGWEKGNRLVVPDQNTCEESYENSIGNLNNGEERKGKPGLKHEPAQV